MTIIITLDGTRVVAEHVNAMIVSQASMCDTPYLELLLSSGSRINATLLPDYQSRTRERTEQLLDYLTRELSLMPGHRLSPIIDLRKADARFDERRDADQDKEHQS